MERTAKQKVWRRRLRRRSSTAVTGFFCAGRNRHPRAGKRSVGNASGGTGKAGHCRILELDGKTYYAEEFCYDGKVYLFGGGHLAQELVPVLHHLDFCCIVLDDREEYVDKALFPDAGQTMLVDFTKLDEILSIRKNDYLVIVTRGHRCDADAEAFALRTGASYIGVVGSRRKTKYVRENWKRRVLPENSSTVSMPRSESRSEARRRRRLQSALPHSSFRSGQQKPENEKVHIRRFIRKYTK